eukprot:TRINITY_DN11767_c0_g1_i1.p1 TRINITY_DN11767_c0_g1~~TRINITY_DN11767_c0_g1_i1.p1  ORF type:complete len:232 (+),score=34.82 TRINITY_DN11767_c0_g1_i1:123-818(+)
MNACKILSSTLEMQLDFSGDVLDCREFFTEPENVPELSEEPYKPIIPYETVKPRQQGFFSRRNAVDSKRELTTLGHTKLLNTTLGSPSGKFKLKQAKNFLCHSTKRHSRNCITTPQSKAAEQSFAGSYMKHVLGQEEISVEYIQLFKLTKDFKNHEKVRKQLEGLMKDAGKYKKPDHARILTCEHTVDAKTLVLDLDETLVHTENAPIPGYEAKFAYSDRRKRNYLVITAC